jgi:hypothetical protein
MIEEVSENDLQEGRNDHDSGEHDEKKIAYPIHKFNDSISHIRSFPR